MNSVTIPGTRIKLGCQAHEEHVEDCKTCRYLVTARRRHAFEAQARAAFEALPKHEQETRIADTRAWCMSRDLVIALIHYSAAVIGKQCGCERCWARGVVRKWLGPMEAL